MYIRRTATALGLAVLIASAGSMAGAASPRHGVERQGGCSRSADWHLEVESEDSRLAVGADVASGVQGQRWSWRILHNGGVSARGNATTRSTGTYSISRSMIDAAGVDRIVFKSHNAATGEQCNGSVRI